MALSGAAVLAIWNGIKPEAEDEFVRWHVQEHIPERVGLAGFLRGRRYVAVSGHPKYFNFYETADTGVLSSPTYLARLNAPTAWTKSVVSHFTDTSRTICHRVFSRGFGDGAAVMTLQLLTEADRHAFVRKLETISQNLLLSPGIVAVHLLEGDASGGAQQTAEKALRDRPDDTAEWILLIEGIGAERLTALDAEDVLSTALLAAGASAAMRKGIYALQYSLAQSQLTIPV